jgi:hypothetical protein
MLRVRRSCLIPLAVNVTYSVAFMPITSIAYPSRKRVRAGAHTSPFALVVHSVLQMVTLAWGGAPADAQDALVSILLEGHNSSTLSASLGRDGHLLYRLQLLAKPSPHAVVG